MLKLANEGLRIKVERTKVMLEKEGARMQDFQNTAREIIVKEEEAVQR